ncbi:MAG: hypothetical protein ACI4SF_06850 [Oscillospiraceae bacterium]
MRELIYREMYLKRKSYIVSFAVFFIIAVMFDLVLLSLKIGNLSSLFEEASEYTIACVYVFLLAIYIPALMASMFMKEGGITLTDLNSGWGKFTKTTTLSTAKQTCARFSVLFIETVAAMAVTLINTAVVCSTSDISEHLLWVKEQTGFDITGVQSISGNISALIAVFALSMFFSALVIPLLYFFKSNVAGDIFPLGVIGVLILYLYNKFDGMKEFKNEFLETENTDELISKIVGIVEKFGENIFTAAPFVLAGAFIAGAVLTAVILNRKEK